MKQTTAQYIMSAITCLLGLSGLLLPHRYNPFRFKNRGVGALMGDLLSEKIQRRIPKIIGGMAVFTGIAVAVLTYFLGEMPFE